MGAHRGPDGHAGWMAGPSRPYGRGATIEVPAPGRRGPGGDGEQLVLAGREAELEELSAALDDAVCGRGRIAVVSGEAGIGKSALVEEFAARASRAAVGVHWSRCFEMGGTPAYWPWVQLFRSVFDHGIPALDDLARSAASRLVPEAVPPGSSTASLDSEENRFRLFDGVVRVLHAASADRPSLFVIEDLQAADAGSLLLLQFAAAHRSSSARYLIVATYRDGSAGADAAAIVSATSGPVTHLHLQRLDSDATAELAQRIVADPLTPDARTALHDATGGHPLFAKALARELARLDLLESFRIGGAVPVPATVKEVFNNRFSQLGGDTAAHLAQLAACGRELDPALAEELLGKAFPAVTEAGLRTGVLEQEPGSSRLRFEHALVQAALLDRIPLLRRRDIHLRIGAAIEALHADDLEPHLAALSHHFSSAGAAGAAKAFQYGRTAGDQAERMGAVGEAAQHYSRALDAAAAIRASPPERASVLAARGHVRIRAGEVEAGREDCRAAWEQARRAGDAVVMAEAALGFATLRAGGVVDEEAVRLMSGALAEIGANHPELRAPLRARLAAEIAFSAPAATREALANEAVAEARATSDPAVVFATLRSAEGAISTPEHVQTCQAWMTEAIAAAESMDDLAAKADAHAFRSVHDLVLGDADAYGADVAALSQLASSTPTPGNEWHVVVAAGCRALLDGRLDDAAAHINHSLSFADVLPNALVSWHFQQFSLAWTRGDLSSFEDTVVMLTDLRPDAAPMFRSALTLIRAMAGRREEVVAALPGVTHDVLEKRQPRLFLLSAGWLAEACWLVGHEEVARTLYEALLPHRDLHIVGQTGAVASYWGSVRRHLANLSLVLEDASAAVGHAEEALAAHARVGAVPFTAHSQFDLAHALRVRGSAGDAPRADALLSHAAQTAKRVGMGRLLASTADPGRRVPALPSTDAEPRLVREGEYWTLAAGATVVRLRDAKGVRYLATLLRQPDREVHALDLAGARLFSAGAVPVGADAVLDSRARAAYQQRIRDLEEEIEEADAAADLERASRLREEWDFLLEELKRATGIGDRPRALGTNPAESARLATTKAIRSVLKKIEAADADLGRHFRATIRTGTYSSYHSDIEQCMHWRVVEE